MTRIKLCGVTTFDNALLCAESGADLLGLNFYPPSPRAITPEAARVITDGLRARLGDRCPLLVGVFVNASAAEIAQIMESAGLDAAQISGDEPPDLLAALQGRAYKAIRPRSAAEVRDLAVRYLPHAPENPRLPLLLVDAYHKALYGGTGEQASLDVALAARELVPRLMLAGGLKPENVAARVQAIQPWAVDTASGIENGTPGIKTPDRVRDFVATVRGFCIEAMTPADWPQVLRIYQEGIDTGLATFETDTPSWDAWNAAHLDRCRLVARNGDQILGWAALVPVSGRCIYAGVAEHSIYIAALARGRGVGRALLNALIVASEQAGFWTLQSGIFPDNDASVGLHKACGFRVIGVRERIGQLHGVWKDVVLMERRSPTVGM